MPRSLGETSVKIIGRQREKRILQQILQSKKAEFLALYGRRRVGKTFLIKAFFKPYPRNFFHMTGIQDGTKQEHLKKFAEQLSITFHSGVTIATQKSWMDAFEDLTKTMQKISPSEKIILFFDELPWMATKRSRLLQAFEYYWNRYWNHDSRIKLIVCGSSASWILEKIINNKKGLYNRVTETIRLIPFTLAETKEFLKYSGLLLNHRQILELYMVTGGIPHYLEKLGKMKRGFSAQQYINELCFQKDGPLVCEFDRLFASLFNNSETYIDLIRKIAERRSGVSQTEMIGKKKTRGGGRAIQRLKQLEESGFILSFIPHKNQKRGTFFKIVDEYTLFYLSWIEPNLSTIRHLDQGSTFWLSKAQSPSWKSWAGLAFEAVCNKHIAQIRKALDIDPGSEIGSWRYAPRSEKLRGTQIDLLFDQPNGVITICEIKHSDKPFAIDKDYAEQLKRKTEIYKEQTKTQKQIFFAMITSAGLKSTKYSKELVSHGANLEDLFVL